MREEDIEALNINDKVRFKKHGQTFTGKVISKEYVYKQDMYSNLIIKIEDEKGNEHNLHAKDTILIEKAKEKYYENITEFLRSILEGEPRIEPEDMDALIKKIRRKLDTGNKSRTEVIHKIIWDYHNEKYMEKYKKDL